MAKRKFDLKIVDYLDIKLNLNERNEKTTYIYAKSDHPPQIVKKIPRSIEKRLSRLSSTK